MKDDHTGREPRAEQIALFRYGLISDVIRPADTHDENKTLYERLREKAARSYCIPGTRRTKVAVETMRDWLALYKAGGFDALKPKARKDIGRARAIDEGVADLLVSIKDEHRAWSVAMVIDNAKNQSDAARAATLPLSTVHRILSRAGVMEKRPEDPTSKDRLHFAYERAGELWMSDVMHGPAVYVAGRRKQKTYLICFLDDATRVVPYADFAFSESTNAFLPVLKQAILRRGIPLRLYVDNGSAFRSHHLALVCARLGITLIHARPYKPQGKGRVERAIQDVRDNFFAARDFASVADLNVQAMAWCREIALERRVPDQKHKTVLEAFAEDKAVMIPLAEDEFPVEECLEVRVGKTPYLRFDKNDYSVPHTHVQRNLSVIASDERVRIIDPESPDVVLADHPRTFDRDQRVEQE